MRMLCAGCAFFKLSSDGHYAIQRAIHTITAAAAHALIGDIYRRWMEYAASRNIRWKRFILSIMVDCWDDVGIAVYDNSREAVVHVTSNWIRSRCAELEIAPDSPEMRIWQWDDMAELVYGPREGELTLVGDVTVRARFHWVPKDGTIPAVSDPLPIIAAKLVMAERSDDPVWAMMRRLALGYKHRIYPWIMQHVGRPSSVSEALHAIENAVSWAAMLDETTLWGEIQQAGMWKGLPC